MFRGKTTFKCAECGKRFEGLDIEYNATVMSQPMPCPECGSNHTMPASHFLLKGAYKKIWEEMDNKN